MNSTLRRWGICFAEADTELLAVELVRHSIHTCGVTDEDVRLTDLDELSVLHLRLLGFERTLGVEVWDDATQPARLPAANSAMDRNGLALVDARSKNWGSALTSHGRVTWAELDLYDRTPFGLPVRTPRSSSDTPTASAENRPPQDIDLMRRLWDGLER
ncbi:MAG: hypothetical protein ACJ72N_05960 [Labedaea sp.]